MEVKIPLSLDEVWALMRHVPLGQINTVVVETEKISAAPPAKWNLLDWGRGFSRRSIDWTEAMLYETFHVGSVSLVKIITRQGVYLFDRVNRYIFVNDTTPFVTPQHLMELGIVAGHYEWIF